MPHSDDATGPTSARETYESLKILSCTCPMGPHLRILQGPHFPFLCPPPMLFWVMANLMDMT